MSRSWSEVSVTADEFVPHAVQWLEHHIQAAIAARDKAVVGLCGGSTPKEIYAQLGRSERVDWKKVVFFLIDERYIAADHADSNTNMIRSTLLGGGRIPSDALVVPNTNLPYEACVADYAARLDTLLSSAPADVVTLGMGDDGHIASLFPPVPEAGLRSDAPWALPAHTDRFAVPQRITVPLHVLVAARAKVLLLRSAKRAVYDAMCGDGEKATATRWPAAVALRAGEGVVIIG